MVNEIERRSPVTNPLPSDATRTAKQADARWAYWRSTADGIVELGTLEGCDVGLRAHFHAEDQITFVVSGRRRFVLGGEIIVLVASQGILIPAGVVHRSMAEPAGVACINAYALPGEYAVAAMLRDLGLLRQDPNRFRAEEVAAVIREHRRGAGGCPPAGSAGADRHGPVGRMATQAGMSREGFSRRFARDHGMPPHAFWRMDRLNHARGLLRTGEGIAAVAAETRFTDQSHFGRCFLRAFGITPGRYRAGWPRSQTCQTRH
jgi:AraC-like DNA-binding protein/mannose-6-phosphate isomerase-like protein (cupin superfamily)